MHNTKPIQITRVFLLSLLYLGAVTFSTFSLTSCKPRGESNTLDEVSRTAKERFVSGLQKANLPAEIKTELSQITELLELAEKESNIAPKIKEISKNISEKLATITSRAGYTSRPALGEISDQWSVLSATGLETEQPSESDIKLLVSRSYNILTAELVGVKFALKDRETRQ